MSSPGSGPGRAMPSSSRRMRWTPTGTRPPGIPIRRDIAMTGEITLRGRVLPIGGLKEKLLAAARGGIKTVLIPDENAKDLTEISESIKAGLEIIPVARMDEVIAKALVRQPKPIVWEEDTKLPVTPDAADEAAGGLTAH